MSVGIADIERAAERLKGMAVKTPVLESPRLNQRLGGRVLFKAECLQRTGSFKFRGAWNMISQIDPAKTPGGVVAFSSGNHAQGVAAAAGIRGLRAVIVMPADTPQIKQENTKGYGAEVITYDRASQDREAIAGALVKERGAVLVPPFEHEHIIAGQGTAGLELAEDAAQRGVVLDDVLVNCSGGGLVAGVATAFAARSPSTKVYAVEPEGFDDTARSLKSGVREKNPRASGSLLDALMSVSPGELTFAINRKLLAGAFAVSDAEACAAMRFAFDDLKLVVEPGGAAGLAAVLQGRLPVKGRTIGVILSGGNVDAALYARVLKGEI